VSTPTDHIGIAVTNLYCRDRNPQ